MSKSAATGGRTRARGWQRRPYRYALALVLACASLIAIILLYADRSIPLKDKFTQIGAGLAASIIFAIIYTVLANREYAELIRSEIETQLEDHLTDILHHIKQLNQLFLPTDQYPAGQVRWGEDPRLACSRELLEETGLKGQVISTSLMGNAGRDMPKFPIITAIHWPR